MMRMIRDYRTFRGCRLGFALCRPHSGYDPSVVAATGEERNTIAMKLLNVVMGPSRSSEYLLSILVVNTNHRNLQVTSYTW